MQRIFLKTSAVALLMNLTAYGQSLADVARQYKEKQDAAQTSGAKPKVITNQDLGEGPEGHPELRVERRADRPTTTASAAGSPAFERPYGEMNRHPENPFSQGQARDVRDNTMGSERTRYRDRCRDKDSDNHGQDSD